MPSIVAGWMEKREPNSAWLRSGSESGGGLSLSLPQPCDSSLDSAALPGELGTTLGDRQPELNQGLGTWKGSLHT